MSPKRDEGAHAPHTDAVHGLAAFGAGLLFSVGLVVSGMTQPAKVKGFLDIAGGAWDPSLAFVLISSLTVHAVGWQLLRRRRTPFAAARFFTPTRRDIDARLLGGATIFGVGWGLGGLCPGPALVALSSGSVVVLVFVGAMLMGMRIVASLEAAAKPQDQPVLQTRPRTDG